MNDQYESGRRSSKIDIKEMCKKFENMPDDQKSISRSSSIESSEGIVHLRRNSAFLRSYREKADIKSRIRTSSQDDSEEICDLEFNARLSVRDKKKLFEKDVNNEPIKTPIPPAKPPRANLQPKSNGNCIEINEINGMSCNYKPTVVISRIDSVKTPIVSSKSLSYEPVSSKIEPTPRLASEPNVLPSHNNQFCNNGTTPKSTKLHNIFSRLKGISNTAHQIRDKMQKHIFVDLTPTTVSPPKHYGTLKRSHSDEHIYAEPFHVEPKSKIKDDSTASSHYMVTSIVEPQVPIVDKKNHEKVGRVLVRNMIYESFSMVRRNAPVRENPERFLDTVPQDDSDAEVSAKDIQDRIIYVKSIKRQNSVSNTCVSTKLYEAIFVLNLHDNQPEVLFSYPEKKTVDYPLLPHICFPDTHLLKCSTVYNSETFYFSVVDAKDEKIFGYCHRILSWPENAPKNCIKSPLAICILSTVGAPLFYKKLLSEVEKHLSLPREVFFCYIASLRKLGVPNAGANLSIPDHIEFEDDNRVVISRHFDSHFVGFELTRSLQLLDVDVLIKVVASLLLERQVLLISSSNSNLIHCCNGIATLLYPFNWQHVLIPILPTCLLVHCCMESPYLMGILTTDYHSVLELLTEHKLLIIDIDKGLVVKSFNDEDTILPKKVQKAVSVALNLAKNMTDPTEMIRDVMISEAFVHMFVEMIGHYENQLIRQDDQSFTIQKEAFCKGACSGGVRSFLEWFCETQMFDAFLDECLWRVRYRSICQYHVETFFEKRVQEYKWQLQHESDKISKIIGKKVRNLGERLKGLKKN